MCSYLAGDEHRLRLSPFVGDTDETVAAAITLTFGHLEFATTSDQLLRHTIPTYAGSLGRSHMYALGMTASPGPGRDRQLVRGAGLAAPGGTLVAAGRPGDPLKSAGVG